MVKRNRLTLCESSINKNPAHAGFFIGKSRNPIDDRIRLLKNFSCVKLGKEGQNGIDNKFIERQRFCSPIDANHFIHHQFRCCCQAANGSFPFTPPLFGTDAQLPVFLPCMQFQHHLVILQCKFTRCYQFCISIKLRSNTCCYTAWNVSRRFLPDKCILAGLFFKRCLLFTAII